jgi:hypothetical protein
LAGVFGRLNLDGDRSVAVTDAREFDARSDVSCGVVPPEAGQILYREINIREHG